MLLGGGVELEVGGGHATPLRALSTNPVLYHGIHFNERAICLSTPVLSALGCCFAALLTGHLIGLASLHTSPAFICKDRFFAQHFG